jgi:Domain of unknown function (DUF4287)/Domain of unknown function (DUF5655)
MSFQAYLDTIKAKTGKGPEDFRVLAEQKGLLAPETKPSEIVAWLKKDFGLGHGHSMAVVLTLKNATRPRASREERIDRHFRGARRRWRGTYERLMARLEAFGPGVTASPTDSYISLLRNGKKFGILQVTGERLDIGIKNKHLDSGNRAKPAGDWNQMVTHRVQIEQPAQLDGQILAWLRQAFDRA